MHKTNYQRIFYDIEVSPAIAWGYPPYFEFNFIKEIECQKIMSISMYNERKDEMWTTTIEEDYVPATLRSMAWSDKKIVKRIHSHLVKSYKEGDIILIGHNSDKFDIKMLNARFVYWGLDSLPYLQSDDTIKMARKSGKFASNSLDYLCTHFGIGGKIGSHAYLWEQCIMGDDDSQEWAWNKMRIYNERDVEMTVELYYKLLPYVKVTNVSKYQGSKACDSCGSTDYTARGCRPALKRFYKRYQCNICSSWFRSDKTYKTREEALSAPKGV